MYKLFMVFLGGALGSTIRYMIDILFKNNNFLLKIPISTFLVNILGCFLLGLVISISTNKIPLQNETKLFLTYGFCGSFTTFSTFTFDIVNLYHQNEIFSFVYLIMSIVLGICAFLFGGYFGKTI